MKKALIFLPIVATLLGSCVGTKHYDEEKYMTNIIWDTTKDFKILQLSDIHLSQSDLHEEHFEVISRTIKAADPDLIVLNGDIFTFADKHVVNKVFDFINKKNIPWTYTFGNHDDQGYYADNYIPNLLTSGRYINAKMRYLEDDDVSGRTNFVINLKDKNDPKHKIVYQVYVLDSHSYNFNTMKYDCLKEDQIKWYERMVNYATAHPEMGDGKDKVVPSSLYMHIGMPEVMNAWDQNKDKEHQTGLIIGDMEEWAGSPNEDPGSWAMIQKLGSTKSIHVAHDHANDSVMLHEGIYVCFGVHATNRIYNDENGVKIGGQVVKIDKTSKELSFRNYYVSYNDSSIKTIPNASADKPEGWAK